jgi:hypothetical protein
MLIPEKNVQHNYIFYSRRTHAYNIAEPFLTYNPRASFLLFKGHMLNPFLPISLEHLSYFSVVTFSTLSYLSPHLFYFSKVTCLSLSYLSP